MNRDRDDTDQWDGGWDADAAAKRRTWARMSAGERFAWLEDALTFAAEHGLLDRERQRRATLAEAAWSDDETTRTG